MKKNSLIALTLCLLSCASSTTNRGANSAPPSSVEPAFSVSELPIIVGGKPVLLISQPVSDHNKPQIVEVYALPGRGMNIYKIRGYIPGQGVIDLIASDSFDEAHKKMSSEASDSESLKAGGAILAPYADEIRWHPPGALPHDTYPMGGLILSKKMSTTISTTPDEGSITGVLQSESFDGAWPSQMDLAVTPSLQKNKFTLTLLAKNVGKEPLPVGLGWSPHFAIPSSNRDQARIRIPSLKRIGYHLEHTSPSGKLWDVKDTRYDFSSEEGRRLGGQDLNQVFTNFERNPLEQAVFEVIDQASGYGVRMKAISSQIKNAEVQAPSDENFVVIQPQFNHPDPYGKGWHKEGVTNTDMLTLQPGETAQYVVELELFSPKR